MANQLSIVEQNYLQASELLALYPDERIQSIIVNDYEALGKLTALRLLAYIEENPSGVIALPTGKTPESFLKALAHYKGNWSESLDELRKAGIQGEHFPDTSKLKFVQLDEYYPIDPRDERSFTNFVRTRYLNLLEISPENSLTMEGLLGPTLKKEGISTVFPDFKVDLNLLEKKPKTDLQKLQKKALKEAMRFCKNYEKKIEEWGGIGFFLGGIGFDGHIAFNLPGSMHDSRTRLVSLNYPTSASMAPDFGGIDATRNMAAATIGLATISLNPNVIAIIFADGDEKAKVIARSIQSIPRLTHPATFLQYLDNAKFYLTKDAARELKDRKPIPFQLHPEKSVPNEWIDEAIIELSLLKRKTILHLTKKDFAATPSGTFILEKYGIRWSELKRDTVTRLEEKLNRSLDEFGSGPILHLVKDSQETLLSYFPLVKLKSLTNYFACSDLKTDVVADAYALDLLERLPKSDLTGNYQDELSLSSQRFFENKYAVNRRTEASLIAQKLNEKSPNRTELKKAIVSTEEERLWAVLGTGQDQIFSLGDPPDLSAFRSILETTHPSLITAPFDLLCRFSQAVQAYRGEQKPKILAYKSAKSPYRLSEANYYLALSQDDVKKIEKLTAECLSSRQKPAYPLPSYDGPPASYIMDQFANQREALEILLGPTYFEKHTNPRVQDAVGYIPLREIRWDELVVFNKNS